MVLAEETPLGRIAPGAAVWIGGHDRRARRFVETHLSGYAVSRPPEGPIDQAFVTALDADEAVYFLTKLLTRLAASCSVHLVHSLGHGTGGLGAPDRSSDSPEEQDGGSACDPSVTDHRHAQADPDDFMVDLTERLADIGWSVTESGIAQDEFLCLVATRIA